MTSALRRSLIAWSFSVTQAFAEGKTWHQFFFAVYDVPSGSPSRGGDVTVYVCDINQPSLPTFFYSVLVSVSETLSTYFIP